MSFGNNAWKCKPIRNYSDALMFFTRYPKPRSATWEENQRPIYIDKQVSENPISRMKHYCLTRGPINPDTKTPEYFDLVLHSTSVIRYMRPDEDNNRTVYLTYGGWATVMTRDFMKQHGWHYAQGFDTTNNERVAVPYNFAAKSSEWIDGNWLAKLTFNEDNRLIVERSDHMHVYKRVSSKKDKEWRASLRNKMDVLCDMLWMSIESMAPDLQDAVDNKHTYQVRRDYGPFTSALQYMHYDNTRAIQDAKREFLDTSEDFTPQTIDALRALYMCTYQYIYGTRVRDSYTQAVAPTQDEVISAAFGYVMSLIGIKNGSNYETLPKFMLERDFPSARAHWLQPR
jgi:hypothetical protein